MLFVAAEKHVEIVKFSLFVGIAKNWSISVGVQFTLSVENSFRIDKTAF